jgi:hypothetical protein
MKELWAERMEAQAGFVEFVLELLAKQGYQFLRGNDPNEYDEDCHLPYDFAVRSPDDEYTLVDVKAYGSSQIDPALIANALFRLSAEAGAMNNRVKIILIVNIRLPRPSSTLEGEINGIFYEVFDLTKLLDFLDDDEEETDKLFELLDLLRDDHPLNLGPELSPQIFDMLVRAARKKKHDLSPLKEAIISCPEKDGPAFEKACQDAIEVVFDNEFNRWVRQNRVEEGFHKLDLLGLLNPKHDFWVGLRNDFRTRYIVFEFKNYADKISQNEIYTTEKYLFSGALRTVAVMIARNGEDQGATRARYGALREHGKLIILLNQDELIKIIEEFEFGEDHHAPLVDALHNMLRSIGR